MTVAVTSWWTVVEVLVGSATLGLVTGLLFIGLRLHGELVELLERKDDVLDSIDVSAVAAEEQARKARHAMRNLDGSIRILLRASGFQVPNADVDNLSLFDDIDEEVASR